jgi:TonB family protein
MWQRSSVLWGVGLSLALHGVWFGSLGSSALRRPRPDAPRAEAPPVAYAAAFEVTSSAPAATPSETPSPVLPGGPESPSALDTDAREGAGGSGATAERAQLLFSFISPIALQDTELNNLARSQTQRIETAPTRATQEERRATPSAEDAVFLASGQRGHAERRTPARQDPRPGAVAQASDPVRATAAARAAGDTPSPVPSTQARPILPHAAREGTARGILQGHGQRSSTAARVAYARPNVDRGPAATPSEALDVKVRDNHDAELLAAALQRSIVDASTQRAKLRAPGEGGVVSGSGLGLTGSNSGSRAVAYSPGPGSASALDTQDARYVRWFVEQKERVQQELTFPKPRALAKDQGISIYRIVVRRDGRLAQSPHLVRSSGFADFDKAAVVAIQRAIPFSPLPERLLPDALDVTLLIPVAFSNPMVQ